MPSASHPATQDLAALARELRAGTAKLRGLGVERVARALCAAAARLRGNDSFAAATRQQLRASTGLHPAMIEWGLSTTLASVELPVLLDLAVPHWAARSGKRGAARSASPASEPPISPELVAVVLAGNVFSACVRALFLPLLSGAPVLAKTSTHDPVLALALKRALDAVDPQVGRHLAVVSFEHADNAALQAMLSEASTVSVYGSDETVQAISALTGRRRVLAHGHGVSGAYIGRDSCESAASVREAARRLALDAAAYDQLGCLSPHFVWLEAQAPSDLQVFARALSEQALEEVQDLLPRGHMSLPAQAAELQWRGIAAAVGHLFTGSAHAVSLETGALRPSPGYRNLALYACSGPADFAHAVAGLGAHLKSVGVAGSASLRAELALQLSTALGAGTPQPRLCQLGAMQTPPFDADADGHPALYGLSPSVECSQP